MCLCLPFYFYSWSRLLFLLLNSLVRCFSHSTVIVPCERVCDTSLPLNSLRTHIAQIPFCRVYKSRKKELWNWNRRQHLRHGNCSLARVRTHINTQTRGVDVMSFAYARNHETNQIQGQIQTKNGQRMRSTANKNKKSTSEATQRAERKLTPFCDSLSALEFVSFLLLFRFYSRSQNVMIASFLFSNRQFAVVGFEQRRKREKQKTAARTFAFWLLLWIDVFVRWALRTMSKKIHK